MVRAYPPSLHSRCSDAEFPRNEDVVELRTQDMRVPTAQGIREAASGKTRFDLPPLAAPSQRITKAAA